ncbi:peptidylprolyl isomerase [Spirosoma radiotolerans]|uniref:PpiC domain-containing protein n=1 Tax=Spirosoma radiotolerans TaxID=1379870 RepID=A0A0E3V8C7_9BACT|nr:peptidylprolyl isomerase [Spirosoma radiotolerans]AKD56642.1 hypothetical protein SD10_18800 [Spirosoma radiotolerans]
MKYRLLIFFVFISGLGKAQSYNRETNNNKTYNDSTAKVEIYTIYELLKHGEKFDNMAIKFSQDPGSYKEGGALRPSTMEGYVGEYRNIVLNLSIDEISIPFKTEYGYHIVQLISKKDDVYGTRHILLRID